MPVGALRPDAKTETVNPWGTIMSFPWSGEKIAVSTGHSGLADGRRLCCDRRHQQRRNPERGGQNEWTFQLHNVIPPFSLVLGTGTYLFELHRRFGLPADREWAGAIDVLRTAVRKGAAFLPRLVI